MFPKQPIALPSILSIETTPNNHPFAELFLDIIIKANFSGILDQASDKILFLASPAPTL